MNLTASFTFPRRFLICFYVFLALFLTYALRLNLSVAVVSMTSFHPVRLPNGTIAEVREFDWDSKQKGYVLSSFFFGYLLSELPAGWLSQRFGGATTLGVIIFCSSLSTLLLPFVTTYGVHAVIIFRSLVGIFEGGSYPCTYTIFSRWAPSEEKSALLSLSLTGPYVALAVCFTVYGVLAHHFGWRTLFYVPGILGLIWTALWIKEGRNDPKNDPKITKIELEYLQNTVGETYEKKVKYPWKKMFTSPAVWSIFIADIGECWGCFTMFTELPSFFNDVYKYNVNDTGMLLCIPYTVYAIGTPLAGALADYWRIKEKVTTGFVRKLSNSFCYYGQAVCMGLIIFSGSPFQTIVLLTIWSFFGSFASSGFFANILDVAPPYSGVIMGAANTFGAITASICPTVSGYIVINKTKAEWNLVFLICGIFYFVCSTFYLLFASGDVQEWAKSTEAEKKPADNYNEI